MLRGRLALAGTRPKANARSTVLARRIYSSSVQAGMTRWHQHPVKGACNRCMLRDRPKRNAHLFRLAPSASPRLSGGRFADRRLFEDVTSKCRPQRLQSVFLLSAWLSCFFPRKVKHRASRAYFSVATRLLRTSARDGAVQLDRGVSWCCGPYACEQQEPPLCQGSRSSKRATAAHARSSKS